MEKLKPRNNSVKQQIPLKRRTSFENENLLGIDRPEQVLFQKSKPSLLYKTKFWDNVLLQISKKKSKMFLRLFLHIF